MSSNNAFVLTIALIIWVFCHTAWIFVGVNTYYIGTAIIILASAYVINSITRKGWHKLITRLFLYLALNNIADELFFDPKQFDINEYLTFIFYTIYTIYKNWKHLTKSDSI